MGIGFLLLLCTAAAAVLAGIAAVALLGISARTGGPERRTRVFRWLRIALPAGAAYAAGAFAVYWGICTVRGVDPGIGDDFRIPLGHGYSLNFIDTPDEGFVQPPGSNDSATVINAVHEIGTAGELVFGMTEGRGFLVDTQGGRRETLENKPALIARLAELGVPNPQIGPADAVYFARRWGWADVVVPLVLGVPAVLLVVTTLRRAWLGKSVTPAGAVA